jgi:hypothetical protein
MNLVWWGVLLHTTFGVPSFICYAPLPAVIPLFEALVQGILCDLIQHCHNSLFILIRASRLLSFQEPFQLSKEVIIGGGGIWWLWKHKLRYVSPDVHQPGETNMQVHCCVKPISSSPTQQVFPEGSLSKAVNNVPVHCLVHSVALWNVLLMNSVLLSKKTSNITLPLDG